MQTEGNSNAPMRRSATVAILAVGYAAASLPVFILPVLVETYIDALGISPDKVRYVVSGEFLAVALGSLLAASWVAKLRANQVVAIAMALFTVANIGCYFIHGLVPLIGLRLVAGFTGGVAQAFFMALAARTEEPNRTFSRIFLSLSVFVTVLFIGIPYLEKALGSRAILILLTSFGLLGVASGLLISQDRPKSPDVTQHHGVSSHSASFKTPVMLAVIVTCFCYQSSQTGIWTLAEMIAKGINLSFAHMNFIFAAASVVSIATMVFASWLGRRVGLTLPLLVAVVLAAAAMYSCSILNSGSQFTAAFFALWISQYLSYPYYMTLSADVDPTGRLSGALAGVQSVALIGGSAVASLALGSSGNYAFSAVVLSLISLASIGVIWPSLCIDRRSSKLAPLEASH